MKENTKSKIINLKNQLTETTGSTDIKVIKELIQETLEIVQSTLSIGVGSSCSDESKVNIKGKTGVFVNPKSGDIWRLASKNGKFLVESPIIFEIKPIAPNRFKPVDKRVNIEIAFEQQSIGLPMLMHIYTKGEEKATYEALC